MKKRDSVAISKYNSQFLDLLSQQKSHKIKRGFTIVELLVVIVVIGILASITIVSFSGVSQKAVVAALQSDLNNASKQLKLYNVIYSTYPTALDANNCPSLPTVDATYCLKISNGSTISYKGSANQFSLVASKTSTYYKITNDSAPTLSSSVDYGLVEHYTFNNDTGTTIIDSSGNGFNGTVQATVSHVSNNMGQALDFDATNEFATIPRAHSFANNLEGSYAFWFKSLCAHTSNVSIFNPGTTRVDTNFETSTRKIFVFNYDTVPVSNLVWKSSDATYMNGSWHHIIVNKTSTRIDVYMNGVNVGGLNTILRTNADAANGTIGQSNFTGSYDDIRVYNRSLTASEIQTLYSQATP